MDGRRARGWKGGVAVELFFRSCPSGAMGRANQALGPTGNERINRLINGTY